MLNTWRRRGCDKNLQVTEAQLTVIIVHQHAIQATCVHGLALVGGNIDSKADQETLSLENQRLQQDRSFPCKNLNSGRKCWATSNYLEVMGLVERTGLKWPQRRGMWGTGTLQVEDFELWH
ncbi:uncharacterized protein LOC135126407 [Zophobas morio]|uniref:uncharacterized protein LOC135126407 n=1 Tax=Zophobas morio TaxID=2755281 RepID=UPI003082FFBF